jgi:pyruvate dehydrogenase E2 component (dihydrolipoamide acetyltransferase)
MATPVEMPKLGNTVEECLLARWAKAKGDRVAAGDLIAEIETDKANFDLVAPAAGIVLEQFFPAGQLVPVYANICVIGEAGEETERYRPAAEASGPAVAAETAEPVQAPAASRASMPTPAPAASAAPAEAGVSPRARRFAREYGIETAGIAGSGPGGRVLERDVKRAFHSGARLSPLAATRVREGYEIGEGSGPAGLVLSRDLGEPPAPLSNMRTRIARRMRESLAASAQYTLHASANAAGLLSLRAEIKASRGGEGPSIGDMVMFATVRALAAVPELNMEFVDGKLYRRANVNIGFACDTPRGLLVPVIKESQKLSLGEVSARAKALAAAAIEGGISPDDLTGGTFTVSNLGAFGIESFTPLLNPPQVAILGVNAIQLKPVRRNGAVEFIDSIGLSLTLDHQIVDGAPGARFLKVVREKIEAIASLAGGGW